MCAILAELWFQFSRGRFWKQSFLWKEPLGLLDGHKDLDSGASLARANWVRNEKLVILYEANGAYTTLLERSHLCLKRPRQRERVFFGILNMSGELIDDGWKKI